MTGRAHLTSLSLYTPDAGWLCKIELKDADEMKDLMDAEAYQAHCEGKN